MVETTGTIKAYFLIFSNDDKMLKNGFIIAYFKVFRITNVIA